MYVLTVAGVAATPMPQAFKACLEATHAAAAEKVAAELSPSSASVSSSGSNGQRFLSLEPPALQGAPSLPGEDPRVDEVSHQKVVTARVLVFL